MEGGSRSGRKKPSATELRRRNHHPAAAARDDLDEAGSSCHCNPVKMNPKLWSRLPQHIIDCIYARVPYVDFFRLRCVCRRWNTLVLSAPAFLESNPGAPFPEPWFLVITKQFIRYLVYDAQCKSWLWLRLPGFFQRTWTIGGHGGHLYAIIKESAGTSETVPPLKVGVFDPRTKVWKELPPLPKPDQHVHLHGMVKQHREAAEYKLVVVTNPDPSMKSERSTTQVYDSATSTWALSAAKVPRGRNGLFIENTVCCNGALYAYNEQPYELADPELADSAAADGLLTLDLANECWSWVAGVFPCETPLFQVFGLNMSRPAFHYGLIAWQGHVYAAAKNMRNIGRISFSIWQLEEVAHAWKEVDQMPWDHFNWLSNEQDYPNYGTGTLLVQHNSFHCRNLVLICGFLEEEDLPFKFVLYDLHKREWHRLDVPLLLGHAGCADSFASTDSDERRSSSSCSIYTDTDATDESGTDDTAEDQILQDRAARRFFRESHDP